MANSGRAADCGDAIRIRGCYCDPCCAYDNFSMSPATLLVEVNGKPVALVPFGCYCNGQQDILEANITVTNTSTAIYVNGGLIGVSPGTTTINVDFAPVVQGGVNCYGAYNTSNCYSAPAILHPPPTANVTPVITSITPDAIMAGRIGSQLTIAGAGFGTSPTVNLPSGITLGSQSPSDSQIQMAVNISPTAPFGQRGD